MHGTHESSAGICGREEVDSGALARRDAVPAALVAAPGQLASALSRSDAGSREDVLARLQSAGGNHEVGRLLQPPSSSGVTHTETVRYPFTATIRKAPSVGSAPAPAFPRSRSDKPPEAGHDSQAEKEKLFATGSDPAQAAPAASPMHGAAPAGGQTPSAGGQTPAAAGSAPGPAVEAPAPAAAEGHGEKFTIPDVHLPELAEVERCDSVVSALGYSGSITRGGAQPSGFGVTRSFSSSLTNISISSGPGMYVVTATLEHPITYQIRSATGPDGQASIASDTDSAITAANYATVASDLTPNMSDLNGRPPRTSFWAEDLTVKHELVHANDDKGNGPLAMVQVMTWLNQQTASNPVSLALVFSEVPRRFAANLLAALSTEDGEKHAYGDGAPSYKTRADAITARGAKGAYT